MRRNCISKALCFLQITAEHQDCPFFTVSLTIKISRYRSHRSRSSFTNVEAAIGEKAPVNDFGRTVPGARNTAASIIVNGVILLL